jgi:hypothetical protein
MFLLAEEDGQSIGLLSGSITEIPETEAPK